MESKISCRQLNKQRSARKESLKIAFHLFYFKMFDKIQRKLSMLYPEKLFCYFNFFYTLHDGRLKFSRGSASFIYLGWNKKKFNAALI